MRFRWVVWTLLLVIVGVSIDNRPDPPALNSHSSETQLILAIANHGHAIGHSLPLDWDRGHWLLQISWFPLKQHLELIDSSLPRVLAFHSSDSSPPSLFSHS